MAGLAEASTYGTFNALTHVADESIAPAIVTIAAADTMEEAGIDTGITFSRRKLIRSVSLASINVT
jgi:hypothetical protein